MTYPALETVGRVGEESVELHLTSYVLVGTEASFDRTRSFLPPLPSDRFRLSPDRPFLARRGSSLAIAAWLEADGVTPDDLADFLGGTVGYTFASPAYQFDDVGPELFAPVPDRLIVKLTDSATVSERNDVEAAISAASFTRAHEVLRGGIPGFESGRFLRLRRVAPLTGQPAAAVELRQTVEDMPGVEYAELDWYVINPQASPGPADQWNLNAVGYTVALSGLMPAPIAVLDGGFDENHEALRYDASGALDAVAGDQATVWDTTDPHGTATAGVATSRPPNTDGSYGVAQGATVIPIRVYEAAPTVKAEHTHLADGIVGAIEAGARVISISLAGYLPTSMLQSALRAAEEQGAVVVAGSGNFFKETTDGRAEPTARDCRVQYPAAYGTVISVGAVVEASNGDYLRATWKRTERSAQRWESCYGPKLDVVAPGFDVYTTDPESGYDYSPEKYFRQFAGTSAAAPHVAGIVALLLEQHPDARPEEVRRALYASCSVPAPYRTYNSTKWSHKGPFNPEVGFGVPNLERALREIRRTQGTNVAAAETGPDPRRRENASRQPDDQPSSDTPMTTDEPTTDRPIDPRDIGDAMSNGYDPCRLAITGTGMPYEGKFSHCMFPLAAFLNSLVRDAAEYPTLLADYWKSPYETARIAGLPWHACILLADGDEAEIDRYVYLELARNEDARKEYEGYGSTGGPIGVKPR